MSLSEGLSSLHMDAAPQASDEDLQFRQARRQASTLNLKSITTSSLQPHPIFPAVIMADEEDVLRLSELQVSSHDTDKPRAIGSVVDQDARDEALRAELAGVRRINTVIEGVVASLEKAKDNMETVSSTVASANTLLDLWIRILSQTEHTQRLLLSGHWQGATQDLDDIEAESTHKAQEAERRREHERERAVEREREAAAAEARRAAAERKPTPTRGGTRGGRRTGLTGSQRGGVGGSRIAAPPSVAGGRGSTGSGTTRGGSGIGRGIGGTRGRGRAVR